MNDRPRFPHLAPQEIDRLLTDSPTTFRSSDGVVTVKTPRIRHKITITEEDLALLDETDIGEIASTGSPVCQFVRDGPHLAIPTDPGRSPALERPTVAPHQGDTETRGVEIPEDARESTSVCSFSGRVSSPPPPAREVGDDQHEPPSGRGSLSTLAHGWSALMGHPMPKETTPESFGRPPRFPVFSPLLTQSSKVITGVVASLLSPWATAAPRSTDDVLESSHHDRETIGDVLCDDSLVRAFEKVCVADEVSEQDEVFFSPNRYREEVGEGEKNSIATVLPPGSHFRSAMMVDTKLEVTADSSQYSDAISAPTSPVPSLKIRETIHSPSSISTLATNDCTGDLSLPNEEALTSQSEPAYPSQPTLLNTQEGNAKISEEVNVHDLSGEKLETLPTTTNECHVFPSRRCAVVGDGQIDCPSSTKAPAPSVLPSMTSAQTPPCASPKFIRASCSPFPTMISMLDDDEDDGKFSRGSIRGENSTTDIRWKSKSTALGRLSNAEKQPLEANLPPETPVPRPVRSGDRRSTIKLEHPSVLLNNVRPSIDNTEDLRHVEDGPVSHIDGKFGKEVSQFSSTNIEENVVLPSLQDHTPPESFASAGPELEHDNKENVAPNAVEEDTSVRRRATHRLVPARSAPDPVPMPRRLAFKPKCQAEQQTTDEVKAQLRREVVALETKENLLRGILVSYRMSFEDALDQRSQVQFATASAVAQASEELNGTRRQAATLHGAVLESQKREERIRANIEKCREIEKSSLGQIEALRVKFIRQSEKGVTYQKYCFGKIQKAVESLDTLKEEMDKELCKLRVHVKQLQIKQCSIEDQLKQKVQENQELTRICETLLK